MPSPLTREDVRRLLIDVDDQLAAVREWEPEHPYRDQWATALQGLRYRRGKLAARLDRVSAAGREAGSAAAPDRR